MNNSGRKPRRGPTGRRTNKNDFVTKSGATIRLHRSLADKIRSRADAKLARRADRLHSLPKGRLQHFVYHFQPKRMVKYWFSHDGAIMALKIAGIGLAVGFLLTLGVFAYFRKDLPNLRDISGNNIGGSNRYYDKTGQTLLWEESKTAKRIPLLKDDLISQAMKDATVAIEDKDFYRHGGFDVRGIARAGWNNAFGGSTQGGSTITQQLVKLSQDWTKDRSYSRKIKELILSVELERSYTKAEILRGYLNIAPYGGIVYGVEAAAQDYFGKSAKDVTIEEAAFLAAIPKSPYYFSPRSSAFDKSSFIGRQHYILDLMQQQGKITVAQRDAAKKVDVLATIRPRTNNQYAGIKAPYFVLAARDQLEQQFNAETVKRGGWKITTTLDMGLQNLAEEQVKKGMPTILRSGFDEAALVAEDVKTGQVVAVVGGADFFADNSYHENNFAIKRLPPGSSFKPYDYTSLIENSDQFGAGSVLYDAQGPLEGYPCTNKGQPPPKGPGNCLWDYDFKYPGPLSLRYALGGSRNVPAVKAFLISGQAKVFETAEKLGLKSGYKCYLDTKKEQPGPCYASAGIGDGAYLRLDEHVHGYASISRNGVNLPQTYILKIEDAATNKIVDEWKPSKGTQAVRPESAYIVADILSDPKASYFTNKPHSYKGWKFGLKTGTTATSTDGWLMGFSTQYAAGVWVGYHTGEVSTHQFMEVMTQPIWQGWMDKAHDNLKPEERARPAGVQSLPAFIVRSHVGLGSVEPSPATDLYPPWYKAKKAQTASNQVIDIVSNKLATDCTPERAKKQVSQTSADAFSGDTFQGATGANVNATDDVHKCDDAKPSISFVSTPSSCASSCSFTVTVNQGTHPLSSAQFPGTINLIVDGNVVQSQHIDAPGSATLSYTPTGSGGQNVTAQIIDSVLYEGNTAPVTISVEGGGTPLSPLTINPPSPVSGTTTNASWSGGTAPYTITLKYLPGSPSPPASMECQTTSLSCPINLTNGSGLYQATLQDSAGHSSSLPIIKS